MLAVLIKKEDEVRQGTVQVFPKKHMYLTFGAVCLKNEKLEAQSIIRPITKEICQSICVLSESP